MGTPRKGADRPTQATRRVLRPVIVRTSINPNHPSISCRGNCQLERNLPGGRSKMKEGTANCVDILIAIILPPLGVLLKFGCKVCTSTLPFRLRRRSDGWLRSPT